MVSSPFFGVYVPLHILSDGSIRTLFKTYFLIFLILIAVIGNYACQLHVRYRLFRGQAVPLTSTTGWVHGPGFIKMLVQLRKLPGGWLGWLMLLATVIDIIGEFGVAKTVTKVSRASSTIIPQGMVVMANTSTTHPSTNWEAYWWASLAQVFSSVNANASGLAEQQYGIYRFVSSDRRFMASEDEILGYWSCVNTSSPITYDQSFQGKNGQVNDIDIFHDLIKRDLMHPGINWLNNVSMHTGANDTSVGAAHLTTMFSSNTTKLGQLFEVTAAVDVLDIDQHGSKEMMTWRCRLQANDLAKTVEQIARVIDVASFFSNWGPVIMGALYPDLYAAKSYAPGTIGGQLQFYLNSMIMVSGAQERVTSPNTEGWKIGILQTATIIPYWIISISCVIFCLTVFLLCYATYLFLAIQGLRCNYDNSNDASVSAKEIAENTPVGMLDWMTHAAYESRDINQIPEHKQLKSWILSTTWHAGKRLGIVRYTEHGKANPTFMSASRVQSDMEHPTLPEKGLPYSKAEATSVTTELLRDVSK